MPERGKTIGCDDFQQLAALVTAKRLLAERESDEVQMFWGGLYMRAWERRHQNEAIQGCCCLTGHCDVSTPDQLIGERI